MEVSESRLIYFISSRTFKFGEYQRDYSWGKEQISTLLLDIENITIEDAELSYFIGSVVLIEDIHNGDYGFNIIDGQQRFISFSLLLKAFTTALEKIEPINEIETGAKINMKKFISERLFNNEKSMTRIETGYKDKEIYNAILFDDNYKSSHLLAKNYDLLLSYFTENFFQ